MLPVVSYSATPWTLACQVPLSMEFSRQESWSGLPFPSPGDLSDPGIEPMSPALAGGLFTTEPPGRPSPHYSWWHESEVPLNPETKGSLPETIDFRHRKYYRMYYRQRDRQIMIDDRQIDRQVVVELVNCVQLFGTQWTVACQAPLSVGFSWQEY